MELDAVEISVSKSNVPQVEGIEDTEPNFNQEIEPKSIEIPNKPTSFYKLCDDCVPLNVTDTNNPTPSVSTLGTVTSSSESFVRSRSNSRNNKKVTITKTLAQPSFKIRYSSNGLHSLSVFASLTLDGLKNILLNNFNLRFACFHAGLISESSRFDFHERISLPNLKKITFLLPEDYEGYREASSMPGQFNRLLHFLRIVDIPELESLRIVCQPWNAVRIPLSCAFIPCYEDVDSHPLIDLIRKNQDSLKTLVIGPTLQELTIKLNPNSCPHPAICEPTGFSKIETFSSFPCCPLLPSWSVMLRPQKHLTKLIVTLSHPEVWDDLATGIQMSAESLKILSLNLVPLEGDTSVVDLKPLRSCMKLVELSLQFIGCNMIGWGFLPESIKSLCLSGPISHTGTELMAGPLVNLEDITVHLNPPQHSAVLQANEESFPPVDVASNIVPIAVDIVRHPSFNFLKNARKCLKTFHVECNGVRLDWEELRKAVKFQKEFKLIERGGDFSLEREVEEESKNTINDTEHFENKEQEEEEGGLFNAMFSPCLSFIGWDEE